MPDPIIPPGALRTYLWLLYGDKADEIMTASFEVGMHLGLDLADAPDGYAMLESAIAAYDTLNARIRAVGLSPARRAVFEIGNLPLVPVAEIMRLIPQPRPWYTRHVKECGTEYRGCAPGCPKAQEETRRGEQPRGEAPYQVTKREVCTGCGCERAKDVATWCRGIQDRPHVWVPLVAQE